MQRQPAHHAARADLESLFGNTVLTMSAVLGTRRAISVRSLAVPPWLARVLWALLSVALFCSIWELCWLLGWADPRLLPPPHVFLGGIAGQAKYFNTVSRWQVGVGMDSGPSPAMAVVYTAGATIGRVVAGLLIATMLSITIGVAIRYLRLLERLVLPTVTLLAPVSPRRGQPFARPQPDLPRDLALPLADGGAKRELWPLHSRRPGARSTRRGEGRAHPHGPRQAIDKRPAELSGGMRQRVAVARAVAMRPKVLLMDEPFAALDVQTRAKMQDFLLDVWRDSAASVLFVTHHIDEAIALADRVAVFTSRPGRIKRLVRVGLPRPRDPFSPAAEALRRELTGLLRDEVDRAFAEQEALSA